MVLKELILTVSNCEGGCGLERTGFLTVSNLGCSGLERTNF